MRFTRRRGSQAVAVALTGALILSACTETAEEPEADGATDEADGDADGETDGETDGGDGEPVTITYAAEQEFSSWNNLTAEANAFANTIILTRVQGDFIRLGPDGLAQIDEEFGTMEKTSDEPLTVEYTVNEDAAYSDGNAIDCADLLLGWAAGSGHYEGEPDEEGNPTTLFSTAGTTGLDLWEKPDCEDGDKSITGVYTEPFADWPVISPMGMPAHIVAEQAGITEDELAQAIRDDDTETLAAAAEFYNTGWEMSPGQLIDSALMPSSGPFTIESWEAGSTMTLVPNENYWGEPAEADSIVFRFILEQDQMPPALANLEVDVMSPQPNPELLGQLDEIDGIVVETGESFVYEHVDFDMEEGAFFADRDMREAFAKCIPRQLIVDNLLVPSNENAEVLNARLTYSFQDDYQAQIEGTNYDQYTEQDIEGAREILEAADAVGTEVRIGYQTPNPRRSDVVALITNACNEAGFEIVDAGVEDFFARALNEGDWDVAMFAWVGSAYVSGAASTFQSPTEGCRTSNNMGCYSNSDVDALFDQILVETDIDAQRDLVHQVETILWEDIPTIPLYTHPSLAAWRDDITGIVNNQSQGGLTWNIDDWSRE